MHEELGRFSIDFDEALDAFDAFDAVLAQTADRPETRAEALLKADEMLGMRLTVMHNLWFYNHLMERIRDELDAGTFTAFHDRYVKLLDTRI